MPFFLGSPLDRDPSTGQEKPGRAESAVIGLLGLGAGARLQDLDTSRGGNPKAVFANRGRALPGRAGGGQKVCCSEQSRGPR